MTLCYLFTPREGSGDSSGSSGSSGDRRLYSSFQELDQEEAGERAEDIWMRATLRPEDYRQWRDSKRKLKELEAQNPKPRTKEKRLLNRLEAQIKDLKKMVLFYQNQMCF